MAALKRGDRLDGYYVEQASNNNYPETFCRITGSKFPGALLTCQAYSSGKDNLYCAKVTDDGATDWAMNITNSDLFYKSGDIIDISGGVFSGYITGGNTQIYFQIPIGAKIPSGKNIEVSITNADIRQNGVYLLNINDNVTGIIFTVNNYSDGYVTIIAKKESGFGGTNNDCVTLYVMGKLIIK